MFFIVTHGRFIDNTFNEKYLVLTGHKKKVLA